MARGGGGSAPVRAPLPYPRRCRAPVCSAASPTRRTGAGGVFPNRQGQRGRGVKSAPPSRPHLLGAGPSKPFGETGRLALGPPASMRRGASTVSPLRPAPCVWVGALALLLQRTACSTQRGRGSSAARPRLRPRGRCRPRLPDRAWAGPVLYPWSKSELRDWTPKNNALLSVPTPEFGEL